MNHIQDILLLSIDIRSVTALPGSFVLILCNTDDAYIHCRQIVFHWFKTPIKIHLYQFKGVTYCSKKHRVQERIPTKKIS